MTDMAQKNFTADKNKGIKIALRTFEKPENKILIDKSWIQAYFCSKRW